MVRALMHIHDSGMVHLDIKMMNALRVDGCIVMTDLDAAASWKDGEPAGYKFSSGTLPPEMFYKVK